MATNTPMTLEQLQAKAAEVEAAWKTISEADLLQAITRELQGPEMVAVCRRLRPLVDALTGEQVKNPGISLLNLVAQLPTVIAQRLSVIQQQQ